MKETEKRKNYESNRKGERGEREREREREREK